MSCCHLLNSAMDLSFCVCCHIRMNSVLLELTWMLKVGVPVSYLLLLVGAFSKQCGQKSAWSNGKMSLVLSVVTLLMDDMKRMGFASHGLQPFATTTQDSSCWVCSGIHATLFLFVRHISMSLTNAPSMLQCF